MTQNMDIKPIIELIKMKKDKPDEYKQFLIDLEDVLRDVSKITTKIGMEIAKEVEEEFR